MASVTLQGVQKHFGDNHVVRDLDLSIGDGEFAVLVGPSGCGKSTTLRMIAGLEDISGGELRIGERLCNDLSPRDRDIAMVFQSYALYPHMTVFENMAFGLRIRKYPAAEIEKLVADAARLLGLSDLLQRRPKALSGGQRQRVAMGRAVVREPSVFLFDEPLSNLDAKLRVQMRLEVARLHKRLGATIVYVTHDQVEAMTLADRIAVMKLGVLQQFASPNDVYQRPANTFVATFIGSPAMNLWPVTLQPDGEAVVARGNGVAVIVPSALAAAAQARCESDFTIGVRPQHVTPVPAAEADFAIDVDVVEPLGAETFVYGVVGEDHAPRDESTNERLGNPAVLRVAAGTAITGGDTIHLKIDAAHLQLFDAAGVRVPPASEEPS